MMWFPSLKVATVNRCLLDVFSRWRGDRLLWVVEEEGVGFENGLYGCGLKVELMKFGEGWLGKKLKGDFK